MAFTAKDGSRHTNMSSMKSADARHGAKASAKQGGLKKIGGGAPAPDDDGGMGGDEQEQPQDGAAMAEEHGPATQLDIQHDHEGGRHSVHAVHPDGHEHDSEHPSAEEAHKFAADCAGCGSGDTGMEDGGGMEGGM